MNIQAISQIDILNARLKAAEFNTNPFFTGSIGNALIKALSIQTSLNQNFTHKHLIIASDHGIHKDEHICVIPYVSNAARAALFFGDDWITNFPFLPANTQLIDVGLDRYWAEIGNAIDLKVARGSKNLLHTDALEDYRCDKAINNGIQFAQSIDEDIVSISDYAIGNFASFVMINSILNQSQKPDLQHNQSGFHLTDAIKKPLTDLFLNQNTDEHPLHYLEKYGGYEMAFMFGLIIQLASMKKIVVIEGLSALTSAHIAIKLHPEVVDYLIVADSNDSVLFNQTLSCLNLVAAQNNQLQYSGGISINSFINLLRAHLAKPTVD